MPTIIKLNPIKSIVFLLVVILLSIVVPYVFPIFLLITVMHEWFYTTFFCSQIEHIPSTFDKFKQMKVNYLMSSIWNTKRKQVLKRDHYICQSCQATDRPLVVHHLKGYNKIPNEPTSCLVALCKSCHTYQHKVHGFPQTHKDYMNWNVKLLHKK